MFLLKNPNLFQEKCFEGCNTVCKFRSDLVNRCAFSFRKCFWRVLNIYLFYIENKLGWIHRQAQQVSTTALNLVYTKRHILLHFSFYNMSDFTACLYSFAYISYTYGLSFNSPLRHYTRMPKLILIVQQTKGI